MSTILVSGISGFVGRHLAEIAREHDVTIIGTGVSPSIDTTLKSLLGEYIGGCDLTQAQHVQKIPLDEIDAVINLAGLAQVGASFGDEAHYKEINVRVHTVLAQAILNIGSSARVIAVSSGAVYDSSQPMPLSENSRLLSNGSPYALSKIAMEEAMQTLREKGLNMIIVRPFNHIGPGQLPGFLVPDLASQIHKTGRVSVGNLKTSRDYTDVRDVVKAYMMLATKSVLSHSIYNVCSGRSVSGDVILETIQNELGAQSAEVTIDPKYIRPDDPLQIIGDNSRLVTETGWSPLIPLEQTIKDYVSGLAG